MNNPWIRTHLFADGGRIVKSTRTDYSEHLERDDMAIVVKNLMKEQHKAMFVALRSGELDEVIGFDEGAAPPSEAGPNSLLGKAAALLAVKASEKGAAIGAVSKGASGAASSNSQGKAPSSKESDEDSNPSSAASTHPAQGDDVRSDDGPTIETRVISIELGGESADGKSYGASRPASIFSVPPPNSGSIFGQGLDEKSLDDAILSYLAEDSVPVIEEPSEETMRSLPRAEKEEKK